MPAAPPVFSVIRSPPRRLAGERIPLFFPVVKGEPSGNKYWCALILARNAVYDKRDESPHPSCHIAASTTVRASVYADEQVDSASICPGTGAPARQHSAVPAAQSSSAAVSCDPG